MKTGVIAAGHPQTAQAGAQMLEQGGNAVDAAVAAAFASFVAESALVNIGGGGIAQLYNPHNKQAIVYDFFSNMPGLTANGTAPPTEIDFRQVMVDFGSAQQPFYIGRGSVAVPGVVAGLCAMVEERGRLPLSTILLPTIRLAQEGVVMSDMQAYIAHLLNPIMTDTPEMAAIYAPDGRLVGAGERIFFTDLAETLIRLGREGATLFYDGAVAEAILVDQRFRGGLLTEADLSRYQVRHTAPITVDYRDYTILLPPPSSDGGVLIAFALKLLADYPLPRMVHHGYEHLRLLIEVMRLTNAARAAWELESKPTDQAAPSEPLKQLDGILSAENLAIYRHQLEAALTGQPQPDPVSPKGPSNTTHISVADSDGMLVTITTSAGESAGFVVGQTGVTLNNMLGEIDLHPNGFHQLPPGQRLATMMSPALVLRNGEPVLAVGSGGSNRLRSAILQVISNVIDFGLPLTEAVDAPRIHYEDGVAQLEGGIPAPVADQLEANGYDINRWPVTNMFFGGAHAVARTEGQAPTWVAAGDGRRGGSTVVV